MCIRRSPGASRSVHGPSASAGTPPITPRPHSHPRRSPGLPFSHLRKRRWRPRTTPDRSGDAARSATGRTTRPVASGSRARCHRSASRGPGHGDHCAARPWTRCTRAVPHRTPRRLGLDQLLQHQLHGVTDHLYGLAGLQRTQYFEQSRADWDRAIVCVSFVEFLGGFSKSPTRWPLNGQEAGPELHPSTGRDPLGTEQQKD